MINYTKADLLNTWVSLDNNIKSEDTLYPIYLETRLEDLFNLVSFMYGYGLNQADIFQFLNEKNFDRTVKYVNFYKDSKEFLKNYYSFINEMCLLIELKSNRSSIR